MARKVMDELEDMMKDEQYQEEISDRLLQKAIQERRIREVMNAKIHRYLVTNKKPIGEVTKEDLDTIGGDMPMKYQNILMEQFMKALRTNRGKPINRIKENHKSILLDQLD